MIHSRGLSSLLIIMAFSLVISIVFKVNGKSELPDQPCFFTLFINKQGRKTFFMMIYFAA